MVSLFLVSVLAFASPPHLTVPAAGPVWINAESVEATPAALQGALREALVGGETRATVEIEAAASAERLNLLVQSAQSAGVTSIELRLRGLSTKAALRVRIGLGGRAEFTDTLVYYLHRDGLSWRRCEAANGQVPNGPEGLDRPAIRALIANDLAAGGRPHGLTVVGDAGTEAGDLWMVLSLLAAAGHAEPNLLLPAPAPWDAALAGAPAVDPARLPSCTPASLASGDRPEDRVVMGSLEVHGGTPQPAVQRAMAEREPRLEQCAARATPDEAGSVTYRLLADGAGRVRRVERVNGAVAGSSFDRCATEALRRTALPAGRPGESTVVLQTLAVRLSP
jgi:hypothetical protein